MVIADSAANENPRMKLNGTNLGYSKHYVLTFQSPNKKVKQPKKHKAFKYL